ncbi:MAG TPA: GNAT family N-acetyltransferase [Puia sp.]|jgi:ElaA protein|nr:GNAT family N-acetyltransferase [Puia sp.]
MTTWTLKEFDQLTPHELYAVLRLRSEVFVVEQNCVFLDMDDKDQYCHHLLGWRGERLVGYSRIVPAGISYAESSIGRIVTSPAARRRGVGRELMVQSIDTLYSLYGKTDIRIGAQYYLLRFYESFGFVQKGEIYLEDGIEHIEMLLTAT